ncbi:hypothetical protein [Thalassotalea sp. SU-HH00458]|uniref:hypothetical protein n=1 Tax=Thalassotalea sp. SU-HH00458 TaxID=3127657 RepID=UPI00310BCDBF
MYKDENSYRNYKTKQQKQLNKSIQELITLDQQGTFKVTICSVLANWLCDNRCLRQLLDAIASYNWEREKDHPRRHVGGYFYFKDKTIFFKNSTNEVLIGLANERHYMQVFKGYKFYSISAVKHF